MIVLKILGYIILAIVLIVVFLFVYTYIDNAAGFKKKREGKWKEKAEKLLGKNLNLRYARQAYYENDNAELAFCINEQIGSYANYIKLSKPQKEALALSLISGVFFATGMFFYHISIKKYGPIRTANIGYSEPLLVLIFGFIVFKL